MIVISRPFSSTLNLVVLVDGPSSGLSKHTHQNPVLVDSLSSTQSSSSTSHSSSLDSIQSSW